MLIQVGDSRGGGADSRLAWSLAAIAGALNAAGFLAAGLYSSNMTGNVSALGDRLALAEWGLALTYLALVVIFVLGAMTSGLLINAGRRRNVTGIYAFSILAEAVLLTGLACADLSLPDAARGAVLGFGFSFLMGLQNAVVTRISNARVRTTHVTGMLTDIGIELGDLLDHALIPQDGGPIPRPAGYDADKLRLHGLTVVSFLGGGVLGVIAYTRYGPYFLFGAAFLLLLLAMPGILIRRVALKP